jgi:hypothetical protein
MKYVSIMTKIILKLIIFLVVCAFSIPVVIILYKISSDTMTNNRIMKIEEEKYRTIIHPKETKRIAFKHQAVHLPNVNADCRLLLAELRNFDMDTYPLKDINEYRKYIEKKGYKMQLITEPIENEWVGKYGLDKIENWDINLENKNISNLYILLHAYPVKGDTDLRCVFG